MNLSDYFQCHGRGALVALARAIAAYPPDVSNWASGERPVPVHRCWAIERATHGAVTRKELRPDDWQDIWPDLHLATSDTPKVQHLTQLNIV